MSEGTLRILVGYASRNGSTREIAERVAERLRATRVGEVDLRPLELTLDVHGYDAFVLASPVYDGEWLKEADDFVRVNLDLLGQRPTWLFSVGTFGDTHPIIGRLMKREPRRIAIVQKAIRPRDYRVFAGVIAGDRWPWFGRAIVRLCGGQMGDNRDWQEIERFAAQIVAELRLVNHHHRHVA